MTDTDLRRRLTSCLATYFTRLSAEEIPRASMATVGEWDSMALVTLVAMVSEEFGVQIAPDDYAKFSSYELIVDYLVNDRHIS